MTEPRSGWLPDDDGPPPVLVASASPRRAALAMITGALTGDHLDVRDVLADYSGPPDELATALALWAAVLIPTPERAGTVIRARWLLSRLAAGEEFGIGEYAP